MQRIIKNTTMITRAHIHSLNLYFNYLFFLESSLISFTNFSKNFQTLLNFRILKRFLIFYTTNYIYLIFQLNYENIFKKN